MADLTLEKDQIDLWVVRPDNITDPALLAQYQQLLTAEETTKQQRFRFAKDRHSALITRAFVRTLLSRYAAIRPEDWRFSKGHKNKPEIIDAPLPLRFNLSHAQGLIVCVVTLDHDIGVDVEYTARKSETDKLAKRYFSPEEVVEMMTHDSSKRVDRFFDYWTLKESYIKACGDGLAIPLDHFSFTIHRHDDIQLGFSPLRNDNGKHWQSWLLQGSPLHRIAISIRDHQRTPFRIRQFQTTPLVDYQSVDLPLP